MITEPSERRISGMQLYCRFKGSLPVAAIKKGPRGGLLAHHEGRWKRVRETRAKIARATDPLAGMA